MKIRVSRIVENLPEAMSIKFSRMASDLRRQGIDIINLARGEAYFDLPFFSLEELPVRSGFHYSDPRGISELRQRLSRYYHEEYGVLSDYETEILISSGSKIIIYMALAAILNPGDEVILIDPSWVSYIEQVRIARGTPVSVPYFEGVDDLIKYHTDKTKAIIINNPSNPSGKVYSHEELQKVLDFARMYNLYIIADEAYSEFVSSEPFISMLALDERKEHVIVINSLSKNMGMSGWRIGYVIANSRLLDLIFRLNQHLISCPATLLEHYFAKYFDQILALTRPQISRLIQLRGELEVFMQKLGLEFLRGTGTFYFCVSLGDSLLGSEEFATRLMQEDHVATVPGIGYGKSLDKFLRVSFGTEPPERIKKGLRVIRELIERTK